MERDETFKLIGNVVSTISVVIGITISVLNFRIAKERESDVRKIEAAKPFLELRQKLYIEALNNASILAAKDFHTEDEIKQAKTRFTELYWGELSLVEDKDIEVGMISLAKSLNLYDTISSSQRASYQLAHSMRKSLINSWGIDTLKIGNVNQ